MPRDLKKELFDAYSNCIEETLRTLAQFYPLEALAIERDPFEIKHTIFVNNKPRYEVYIEWKDTKAWVIRKRVGNGK